MTDERKQFVPPIERPANTPLSEQPPGEAFPESGEQPKERLAPPGGPPQEEQFSNTPPSIVAPTSSPQILSEERTQLRKNIERVLEEDLGDIYLSLKPESRKQFKAEGERMAVKIESLLSSVKIRLIEIVRLIRSWLLLLPGINSYFLEQEAKIKAEKIFALKKSEE